MKDQDIAQHKSTKPTDRGKNCYGDFQINYYMCVFHATTFIPKEQLMGKRYRNWQKGHGAYYTRTKR